MAKRDLTTEPGARALCPRTADPDHLRLVSRPPDPVVDPAVVELEGAPGQIANARANAQALEQIWAEVQRLETAYERAFERAMRQRESGDITTAFDEADRLQGRLIDACRRFRQLRERSEPPPTPPDQAA
jgi:hypothetical protein